MFAKTYVSVFLPIGPFFDSNKVSCRNERERNMNNLNYKGGTSNLVCLLPLYDIIQHFAATFINIRPNFTVLVLNFSN